MKELTKSALLVSVALMAGFSLRQETETPPLLPMATHWFAMSIQPTPQPLWITTAPYISMQVMMYALHHRIIIG